MREAVGLSVFCVAVPSLLTRVLIATLPLLWRKDSQQSLGGLQLLPPCSAQFHSLSQCPRSAWCPGSAIQALAPQGPPVART